MMILLLKFGWLVFCTLLLGYLGWKAPKDTPSKDDKIFGFGFFGFCGFVLGYIVLLIVGKIVQYTLDREWFEVLGFADVWQTTITNQWVFRWLYVGVFAASFSIVTLWLSRGYFSRNPEPYLTIVLYVLVLIGGSVWAADAGAGLSQDILLLKNAQDFGIQDPVLEHDLSYYAFELPVYNAVKGHFSNYMGMLAFFCVALYFLTLLDHQNEMFQGPDANKLVMALMAVSCNWFVGQVFKYLLLPANIVMHGSSNQVTGASAADLAWRIPLAHVMVGVVALTIVIILLQLIFSRKITPWMVAIAFGPFLVVNIFSAVAPGFYNSTVVKPDEVNAEMTQLEHQIEMTRWAYQLNKTESTIVPYVSELQPQEYAQGANMLNDARVVDWPVIRESNNQINTINKVNWFIDTDITALNGQLVMTSAREINESAIPNQTWINNNLVFTHGNCFTVAVPNQIQENGYPVYSFGIKDCQNLAAQTMFPGLENVDTYFGEAPRTWFVVNTKRGAIEMAPSVGIETTTVEYQGLAGQPLGDTFNRLMWAWRMNDSKLLTSGDLDSETRIITDANIIDRITQLAPFLTLDPDPYFVVTDRIMWVVDAYTTLDQLPYVQSFDGEHSYLRNSVKITVDAYDGTVKFYVFDETDPVLQTWMAVYPDLFTPASEMPEQIKDQLRYPEYLFSTQAYMLLRYHQTDPTRFYNNQALMEVPQEAYQYGSQPMSPRYQWMQLPGESEKEFVITLPLTLSGKSQLASWFVARIDGDAYGELRLLNYPQDEAVWGPEGAQSSIEQGVKVDLNLLGSGILWGNMLTFPILSDSGQMSTVYIKPLYLAADDPKAAPTLERVFIVYGQGKVISGESLPDALNKLYAGQFLTQQSTAQPLQPQATPSGQVAPVLPIDGNTSLADQALGYYQAAQACLATSDWTCYGENMMLMEQALTMLSNQQ